VIIAMLCVMMEEGYLADICIIYAMISFLAVVMLTKIHLGIYRKRKAKEEGAQ
jgi:multicomponent Na+:H+ antiporter subunit F